MERSERRFQPLRLAPAKTANISCVESSDNPEKPHVMAQQDVASSRTLTLQDELALKPVIQRLYIEQRLTFPEIQSVLKAEYGLDATRRQLARLRDKWDMKKNVRKTHRGELLRLVDSGLSEWGSIGTVSLNMDKVARWRRELNDRSASRVGARNPARRNTSRSSEIARTAISSCLTRQPAPPEAFRIKEGLVFSLSTYMSGMFDQQTWPLLDNPEHSLQKHALHDFFASCTTAITFIRQNSFTEARKLLSKACNLVRNILIAEHPATLYQVICTWYVFIRNGITPGPLQDVLTMLRKYVANMATIVTNKTHPWGRIWRALGTIDHFDQAIMLAMQVMTERWGYWKRKIGRFDAVTVESQMLHTEVRYSSNLLGGESSARWRLAECEASGASFAARCQWIEYLINNLRQQGRHKELESVAGDFVVDAREHGEWFHLARALSDKSKAEYTLGKRELAFATKREGVDLILGPRARHDPNHITFAIAHMSGLEEWCREWGWTAKSEQLQEELAGLVKLNNTTGVEEEDGLLESTSL